MSDNLHSDPQSKPSVSPKVHVGGDETIKLALIGCGSRGTGAAAQALSTKGPIKLWAMADLFGDRLESSLKCLTKGVAADYDRDSHQGFGGRIDVAPERRFVGFDAFQKALESDADLVILATPPHFRPAHFQAAVERGKHVFMEKPLGVDAPGVRQILKTNETAKARNLKVGVGLMFRHSRRFQETTKRIMDGAVGNIHLLRCYWNVGRLRDTPPRTAQTAEMLYQLRNPYHFLWLSGDYFIDGLLHNMDLCCWAKNDWPTSAQGIGGRVLGSETQRGDTFDFHFVEFAFADGSRMAAQTRQLNGCWSEAKSFANGSKGEADITQGLILGANKWRFHGAVENPYQVEHDVLIDAIRRDRPHNEVEYAARSTMTAIMGRMASYSGKMVSWADAFHSKLRLGPEKYSFDGTPPSVAEVGHDYPAAMPGVTRTF